MLTTPSPLLNPHLPSAVYAYVFICSTLAPVQPDVYWPSLKCWADARYYLLNLILHFLYLPFVKHILCLPVSLHYVTAIGWHPPWDTSQVLNPGFIQFSRVSFQPMSFVASIQLETVSSTQPTTCLLLSCVPVLYIHLCTVPAYWWMDICAWFPAVSMIFITM